ncbi:uncharacterized protein LOC128680271 isoform X3 [Plodia interpunctella]|uniref:uncharacterized protein LOC128680271 isoform X3 n=1 Tax=Plodia interpunctella TaxID=58824 RepID=UPI0023680A06|nr:uncharacterized protein LOC128680271 isoform X3 [Plodia interpunctella]
MGNISKFFNGNGQGTAQIASTSRETSISSETTTTTECSSTNQPLTFEDLLKLWGKNEETEECGTFFVYCPITAEIGGYYTDTDTSIESDEDEVSESNDNNEHIKSNYYFGKNGYQWSKTPVPMTGKTKNDQTISCTIPDEKNPYNIWNRLIDDTILDEILKWTNVKLAECRNLVQNQSHPHLVDLDMIELKCFIGTFLYSVYLNLHIQPLECMFTDEDNIFGFKIFQCAMEKDRFASILNCLSFGDPHLENDTSDRNISILFERLIRNSQTMYKGSGYALLGRTLVPFWGSFEDKQFPMKYAEMPCREGFLLHCMFDVKTGFLHDLYIPYDDLDKHVTNEEKMFSNPTKLALVLTKLLHGTNTNITCTKEYTSFELIDAFAKRDLTCLGIIRQDQKEIPREFLPSKKRAKGSTLYGYSTDVTLMSYMNKRMKATIIASSMLYEHEADTQKPQKPKLLKLFNANVIPCMPKDDIYDMICHRRTTLVSMALFYKMIDFSIHNTNVLYDLNMKRKMKYDKMIKSIAQKLMEGHMMRRAVDIALPEHVRMNIIKCLGSEE